MPYITFHHIRRAKHKFCPTFLKNISTLLIARMPHACSEDLTSTFLYQEHKSITQPKSRKRVPGDGTRLQMRTLRRKPLLACFQILQSSQGCFRIDVSNATLKKSVHSFSCAVFSRLSPGKLLC